MSTEPQFVLEFDYRSDNGPRYVGPFQSREAAFEWAYEAIGGGEASYHAYPLTSPGEHPMSTEPCRWCNGTGWVPGWIFRVKHCRHCNYWGRRRTP